MFVVERDTFEPLQAGEDGADEPLIVHQHPENRFGQELVLFVHGLNGTRYDTWGNLPKFLFEDCSSFDLGLYDYASGTRRVRFSQSNTLESQSEQLADLIRDLGYQRVVLVGHSMGGLLCQNTIKSLIDSRTRDLDGTLAARRVAGLFLMATPQAGSLRVPRIFRFISKDARILAAHSRFITAVQIRFADVVQVSELTGLSPERFYIPTYAMVATNDKWVDEMSSRLGLSRDRIKIVRGTHKSLIKPKTRDDDGYRWLLPRLRMVMNVDAYREIPGSAPSGTPRNSGLQVFVPASLGSDYLLRLLGPLGQLPFETQVRVTTDEEIGEQRLVMGMPDVVDSLSVEIERLRTRAVASRSPEAFSNLGRLLRQRFALTASQTDLDAAVQAFESALEATSSVQTDVAPHLSNLAAALSDRFAKNGSTEDLDRAIELASRAIESAEVNGAEYPEYLANLGAVLYMRYEVSGELRDLDHAIDASEKALRLVSDENAGAYLINLSTALQARFSHTGDPATLDRAIQLADLAVNATSESDPTRWSRLMTLGVSLSRKALQSQSSETATEALRVLAAAANDSSLSDSARLGVADVAALVAASQSEWYSAMQACSSALDSTKGISFERVDTDIATHRARLASDAATCAIRLGEAEQAIRFFDLGRGRFLTGEFIFRRDLSTLAKKAPHLVGSLVELHEYLSVAAIQGASNQPRRAGSDRSRVRERWAEEVERVRQLPGSSDFLLSPSIVFQKLAQAK